MTSSAPDTKVGGPPETYYGNSNPDLLNIIPVTARRIVEFGCGSGALCADFKTRNAATTYIGVEMHAPSAERARMILDHVVCDDAEDPAVIDRLLAEHGTVDVLVYGDTIEHFVDPWRTLESHLRLLAPDGVVCACVPNSQHWSLSVRLLAGHMEYSEKGGLNDRTHLHLFTKSSIRTFFENFGLTITKTHQRKFGSTPASVQDICKVVANATKTDGAEMYEGLTTFQYVVQAARPTDDRQWHIDWRTLQTLGGFSYVRAVAPARFMETIPNVSAALHEKDANVRHVSGSANIFVWQRPILMPENDLLNIRKLQYRKKLIITDFDDDPELWPSIAENKNLTFVGAHAVQVSTEELRQKILPLNPHTFVVPNRIPAVSPYAEVRARTVENTIFVGGFNRARDFEPIADTVNRFIERSAIPWHFYVVGDRRILDMLKTDRRDFFKVTPYKQYRGLLEKADIALLPLKDTPSNRLKSNLKFLEAAAAGAVTLAGTTIYADTVEHGRTGYLFDTPDALETLLESLDDRDALERVRKAAHDYVQRNAMLAPGVQGTLDIYYDLYERYETLDRELNERLARVLPPESLPPNP
ncbi:MAG: methyltransferase domain-containing protein [Alphaproteobacteria bacterium]|nr:methyltransferase domain-containing protein [Alphaproteobacteria bacterium]